MRESGGTVPLTLFFMLLVVFSGTMIALIVATGNQTAVLGLMWSVGAAAIVALKLSGHSLHELGWAWGPGKYHLIALALPFAYATLTYGTAAVLGAIAFLEPASVDALVQASGFSFLPQPLGLVATLVLVIVVGMIQSMSSSLGEEIGWRGFLTPRLTATLGFVLGSLITGTIWGLWHLPLVILSTYNAGGDMRFELLSFGIGVVALSGPMAWLRLKANSLWPCVTLHASHNLFIQQIFDRLTTRGAGEITMVGEFGILFAVAVLLVSVPFWIGGSRLHEPRQLVEKV